MRPLHVPPAFTYNCHPPLKSLTIQVGQDGLGQPIDALAAMVCSFTRAFRAKAARRQLGSWPRKRRPTRATRWPRSPQGWVHVGRLSRMAKRRIHRSLPGKERNRQVVQEHSAGWVRRVGPAQVGGLAGRLLLRSRRLSWNRGSRRPSTTALCRQVQLLVRYAGYRRDVA
jgi:hypothetical protein